MALRVANEFGRPKETDFVKITDLLIYLVIKGTQVKLKVVLFQLAGIVVLFFYT